MFNVKNILVPVDFSDQARLSIDVAVGLAKKEKGTAIFLLNVLPNIVYPENASLRPDMTDLEIQEAKKVKELLGEWQDRIPPPLTSESIVERGRLDKIIGGICGEKNIDLVVMTTHGRSGLERIVHPNETEKVVRMVPCPVLVLHLNRHTIEMAGSIV